MMEFFKSSKVNNFFKKYANNLIFLTLSPETLKSDFGIEDRDFMLPIKKNRIISMVKSDYQEFKTSEVLEGILTILGADHMFRLNLDYVKILNYKVPELEKTIKALIVEDIKKKNIYEAALKLRAYIGFIRQDDMEALSYYGSTCKEICATSKNQKIYMEFLVEAQESFEAVIKYNSNNPLAIYELAYIYANKRELDKAKILLSEGIKNIKDESVLEDAQDLLNNLEIENQLNEAEKLLENDEVKSAFKILHGIQAKTDIQRYNLLFYKGFCYNLLGDVDMALKCYEEAILINNRDARLLAELGLIYGCIGEFEQSLEFYFSALNLEPKNIAILCNLVMIFINLSDFQTAREFLEKALEIDDKDDVVIACLKELRKFE